LHRPVPKGPKLSADKRSGRDARLAAALRDNLRRRKEQARAQAAQREAPGGAAAPPDRPVV
jgi:hypothetical protein